mmetsp:Transcript_25468/g.69154  ORF Transcript_25468/g.69154 Transcript_25468/m.69154 type:complete len:200 (+) Transcript_25468:299-898(+)
MEDLLASQSNATLQLLLHTLISQKLWLGIYPNCHHCRHCCTSILLCKRTFCHTNTCCLCERWRWGTFQVIKNAGSTGCSRLSNHSCSLSAAKRAACCRMAASSLCTSAMRLNNCRSMLLGTAAANTAGGWPDSLYADTTSMTSPSYMPDSTTVRRVPKGGCSYAGTSGTSSASLRVPCSMSLVAGITLNMVAPISFIMF